MLASDSDRARVLCAALDAPAAGDVRVLADPSGLAAQVAALRPDLVLIHLAEPSLAAIADLTRAAAAHDRPVVMFVDRSDESLTRAAIAAGLSAYVVDGLRPERIAAVLDAAIARFQQLRDIRAELAATRAALEERKTIDRAKTLLMRARGIDEAAAYGLLRKAAMDQGKRIGEVARQLVLAAGLLGG